jgi:D-glycero-D-manno-heptose 1,7-bisphosphate phosphatase
VSRPAVFLDRDGTIIEERVYLSDPAGVAFVPGAIDAMSVLAEAGFALVVVTNQAGIARGLYSVDDYHAVAARVTELLGEAGVVVDGTYFCPHHPDMTGPCACRKPGLGMYRQAIEALDLDGQRSFFVGDKLSDVAAAGRLGGQGILVRTGYGAEQEKDVSGDVWVVDDLAAAAARVVSSSNR